MKNEKQYSDVEIIVVKRQDRKGFIQFMNQVVEKAKQGYTLIDDGSYAPKTYPWRACFLKDEQVEAVVLNESVEFKVSAEGVVGNSLGKVLEDLEATKSKADLLAFAAKHSVVVPEDVKLPLAIKKLIKDSLTGIKPEVKPEVKEDKNEDIAEDN